MKVARIATVVVVLFAATCSSSVDKGKLKAVPIAQPMFQVIPAGVNPNTVGIAGAVGNIVQNAQPDGRSWTLGTGGVWQAFPSAGGGGVTADGGVSAPLVCSGAPDAGSCGTPSNPLAIDPSATNDVWAAAQKKAMAADVPALNAFDEVPIAQNPGSIYSATGAVPVTGDGGGLGVANDTTYLHFTQSLWGNERTSPSSISFLAKFPATAANKTAILSMCKTNTVGFGFMLDNTTSSTKFLTTDGASVVNTTVNLDTAYHTFRISNDGNATLHFFIDNVLAVSRANTSVATTDGSICSFASLSLTPGIVVQRIYYAWVANKTAMDQGTILQSDFFGLGATAPAFTEMVGNPASLVSLSYQRQADSGLKIVRTLDDLAWICPGFPVTAGCPTYGSANELALESWLSHQQATGTKVMLNVGWNFDHDLCLPFGGGSCTPSAQNKADFATLYSAHLDHLINGMGFTNIIGINIFTEPSLNAPTSQAEYLAVATQVVNQIVSDDGSRVPIRPRILVTGPQEHNFVTGSDVWLQYMKANATAGVFDVLTEHSYCNQPPYAPLGMGESNCPGSGTFSTFFPSWTTKWAAWEADASPYTFWTDEFHKLAGDPDLYRMSGDDGLLLDRLVSTHLAAGIQADFMWMLGDQAIGPFSPQGYGLARDVSVSADVHPSWYAYTVAANLLGGGRGTGGAHSVIYRTMSNTATTNAAATFTPNGAKGCSDPAGCLTMMIANGDAVAIGGNWTSAKPINRRMCRTLYQSESPPRPTPTKAAYRVPWDSCAVMGTQYPDNVIPPHSVAFYSTVTTWAPPSTSLSPSATVTASSNGSGSPMNVADGSTSHVNSIWNSWVPSSAVGTQWVQLNWSTAQTMNRIVLDFAGTSEPFFYATGIDATHPAPLAAYAVQYWNGSTFVDFSPAINVSGNGQIQRTHTFAAVSTTEVRVSVPQGTTAPINEVEVYNDPGNLDTVLGLYGWTDPASASGDVDAETISTKARTFQAGDFIEYDVTLMDNLAAIGGIDVTVDTGCGGAFSTLSSANWQDQNGVAGAPTADLSARAYPSTYHRKLAVPSCAVGHVSQTWQLVTQRSDRTCQVYGVTCPGNAWFGAGATSFYDNIVVTNGGSTAATIYANGAPDTITNVSSTGYKNVDVFVSPKVLN